MQLTDDGAGKNGLQGRLDGSQTDLQAMYRDMAASLLTSIVETACEHEHSLDLMRLVNYLDLYNVYLAQLDPSTLDNSATSSLASARPLTFEQFVGDSKRLSACSAVASRLYGDKVANPAPLVPSANESVFQSQ